MASNPAVAELGTSFESKLRIPGAKVASSEVSEAAWQEILEQNRQALAMKVLGKSFMSIKKTMEIFTGVLWARAEDIKISYEGEDHEESRFFLAKFATETDMENIVSRSPWTVGGLLVILEACDPLKRVSDHKFQSTPVWLQLHGLPPFAAKNKEISLSLAEKAGSPVEKSLVCLQEFTKLKVVINPSAQLTCGAFLKGPNQSDIPVLFKYEKAGLICYRYAHLGHKEKSCAHKSFSEGSPTAFSFLEGFPALESPPSQRRSPTNGKPLLSAQEKSSLIHPKNLISDLDASLLGSGSKISKLDQDQEIKSTPLEINSEHKNMQGAQVQRNQKNPFPQNSLLSPASSGNVAIEHLFLHGTDNDSTQGYKKGADLLGQTYVFKASDEVALHVTPYLIKKTKKAKGPGPAWQRVPIGISVRKGSQAHGLNDSQVLEFSQNSGSSTSAQSGASNKSDTSSNKHRLLEWKGNFSNFTEEEEESASEEDAISHAGTKRGNRSPPDAEVQISQSLLAWKKLKLGPSASV